MASKSKHVIAYVVIGLSLVIVIWQQGRIREFRSQLGNLEYEKQGYQIGILLHHLRIPSEALYYDGDAMEEISEIRMRYWKEHGTDTFWPYMDVFYSYNLIPDTAVRHDINKAISLEDKGKVRVCSYEHWWLENATIGVGQLALDFQLDQGLGPYFEENPDTFDKVIKPWVLRLTKAYRADTRLKACEVLLNRGDRSEEVLRVIGELISQPKHRITRRIEGEKTTALDFSKDTQTAMALNEQYQLGLEPAIQPDLDPGQ